MELEKTEAEECEECIYYKTYSTGTKDCNLNWEEMQLFCPTLNKGEEKNENRN